MNKDNVRLWLTKFDLVCNPLAVYMDDGSDGPLGVEASFGVNVAGQGHYIAFGKIASVYKHDTPHQSARPKWAFSLDKGKFEIAQENSEIYWKPKYDIGPNFVVRYLFIAFEIVSIGKSQLQHRP